MIRELFLLATVAQANISCDCDCPIPEPPTTGEKKTKFEKFYYVFLECSSSTLLAIDGSTQNGPFWSSIIVEAKAIVKGYEKIKGVNFG